MIKTRAKIIFFWIIRPWKCNGNESQFCFTSSYCNYSRSQFPSRNSVPDHQIARKIIELFRNFDKKFRNFIFHHLSRAMRRYHVGSRDRSFGLFTRDFMAKNVYIYAIWQDCAIPTNILCLYGFLCSQVINLQALKLDLCLHIGCMWHSRSLIFNYKSNNRFNTEQNKTDHYFDPQNLMGMVKCY